MEPTTERLNRGEDYLIDEANKKPHGHGIFVFSDGSEYAGNSARQKRAMGREAMNTSINKDESKRIIYAGEINNGWKDGFGTWWNQMGQ